MGSALTWRPGVRALGRTDPTFANFVLRFGNEVEACETESGGNTLVMNDTTERSSLRLRPVWSATHPVGLTSGWRTSRRAPPVNQLAIGAPWHAPSAAPLSGGRLRGGATKENCACTHGYLPVFPCSRLTTPVSCGWRLGSVSCGFLAGVERLEAYQGVSSVSRRLRASRGVSGRLGTSRGVSSYPSVLS